MSTRDSAKLNIVALQTQTLQENTTPKCNNILNATKQLFPQFLKFAIFHRLQAISNASKYQYNVYRQNITFKLRAEMLRKYFQRKKGFMVDDSIFFYLLLFHDCSVILEA